MIDMHTHILPNIDDGSESMEETIKMLKEAKEVGFTDIITTSHYIENSYDITKRERKNIINEIKSKLDIENINIKLYNGAEAYISNNIYELIEKEELPTLNNSKYLLMELPMNNKVLYLENVIYSLESKGITTIIAHPERYSYVQKDIKFVEELVERGVLFQANYGSIIGKYGNDTSKCVKKLLKKKLIHFLGTDTHKSNSIYAQMNIILKKLEKITGKEYLELLSVINPKIVIDNGNVESKINIKKSGLFGKR